MKKCKIQSKLVQNRIVKITLNLNRKKLSSIGKLNTAFFLSISKVTMCQTNCLYKLLRKTLTVGINGTK